MERSVAARRSARAGESVSAPLTDAVFAASVAASRYVRTIYRLTATGRCAREAQVARLLGVSRASVSAMVKRLARKGLVEQAGRQGVVLSASGRSRARAALRRYC